MGEKSEKENDERGGGFAALAQVITIGSILVAICVGVLGDTKSPVFDWALKISAISLMVFFIGQLIGK